MRFRGALRRPQEARSGTLSLDGYLSLLNQFVFDGNTYGVGFSWSGSSRTAEVPMAMDAYVAALMGCPPAFAAQLVRGELMAQVELAWQFKRGTDTPGKISNDSIPLLDAFVRAGNLERMEWHAGLAGAAYVNRGPNGLRLLQPDRVTVVIGSNTNPTDPKFALDARVAGYQYQEAEGVWSTLLPSDVAAWTPIPDPRAWWRGMSWLTPVIRETQGDRLATEHKLKFFENAGTPNLVFSLDKDVTAEQLKEFKAATDEATVGVRNAYRNLYLGGGADVTVVGADLRQLDFAQTQATGENRIAVASRVPAAILGIKEGLQGSTLNAGNFGQARRAMADTWLYSSLKSLCACLERLVVTPRGMRLGWDPNIPFLREDAKDAAEIMVSQATALRQLWDGGADPESAIKAVMANDMSLLKHTGKLSVQLQAPGQQDTTPTS